MTTGCKDTNRNGNNCGHKAKEGYKYCPHHVAQRMVSGAGKASVRN